ncbi:nuclear transport factor 2 family protein [Bifidobacterium crudilactis]|uniref:nuclear transport factor 2 family protein n=1 Tax=Bifidobacterium crudilactis TaxID=327277 RepID=UPI0006923A5C|nr:nuclear transport factor 2 family protein [Bifidobacterium crudilactis]MCI2148583.1 nuclear transport factor 2 family protein [Bifidobacterium crudilactis]MCI2156995.1 nuclear transport factor 2 family protein [Bifidobacterium crudilactis]
MQETEPISIDAAETALQQAMRNSDVAALDRMISDDLVFVGIDGKNLSKQDDLESHRNGTTRFERLDEISRRCSSAGEGKTTGSTEVVADVVNVINGERVKGRLRWHREWKLTDGRWQVIRGSVSIAG